LDQIFVSLTGRLIISRNNGGGFEPCPDAMSEGPGIGKLKARDQASSVYAVLDFNNPEVGVKSDLVSAALRLRRN
jgi:hypothetical protein